METAKVDPRESSMELGKALLDTISSHFSIKPEEDGGLAKVSDDQYRIVLVAVLSVTTMILSCLALPDALRNIEMLRAKVIFDAAREGESN